MLYTFLNDSSACASQELQAVYNFKDEVAHYIENYKHIHEAFSFLQSQDLVTQSFHEFLSDNLVQDDNEQDLREVNFGDVVEQSHLMITDIIHEEFTECLDELFLLPNYKLKSIQDPIFLYVLHTQNFLIEGLRHQCCQEWAQVQDASRKSRLHRVVTDKNRALISILIDAKINLNIENYTGATPLFYAVHDALRSGTLDIVDMLLNAGADYTIPLHNGWSILHKIVFYANCSMASKFIKLGMNINIQDIEGNAPMHGAARWSSKKIMKLLIKKGADINIQNNKGLTPLHFAARFGHEKIVLMLIHAGANIDIENYEGEKAEDVHVVESEEKAQVIKRIFKECRQGTMQSDNQHACCFIS
ncbi:ankyrin repeat domain-containing protein [Candidatus Chromulinivorax destructor]|uniref:Uncharacterized protein n=1 Tax=Candidatus Chromulinivorax destructor TaxID=2066483 RepID=A0A345ZA38_9BACT|nr:ankyrin repeat domain-containing protein [Candidatus Chromulinivorax destructor]AXK60155.1 hypothetical protein C0J27_00115 [Candidatus Chromulinivorax destructor]